MFAMDMADARRTAVESLLQTTQLRMSIAASLRLLMMMDDSLQTCPRRERHATRQEPWHVYIIRMSSDGHPLITFPRFLSSSARSQITLPSARPPSEDRVMNRVKAERDDSP